MNNSQIWAILECCLLISQEKPVLELINDYGFLPEIAKSALVLYNYFKSFELIGDVFPKLKTRSLPPAKSFEIPFNKIKPGDLK